MYEAVKPKPRGGSGGAVMMSVGPNNTLRYFTNVVHQHDSKVMNEPLLLTKYINVAENIAIPAYTFIY